MTNHVKHEKKDGNGFSGGLRLSWPALAVIMGLSGIGFTIANALHTQDIKAIERVSAKLEKIDDKLDTTLLRLESHFANPHAHIPR